MSSGKTRVHRAAELFTSAFESMMAAEAEHVLSGVSEQNVCGRLAFYLERAKPEFGFGAYIVDTEYNRKQNRRVKTIIDHRSRVIRIRADIIVHTRGKVVKGDNLIAVEMKKSGASATAIQRDRDRLRAMTKSSYDGVWSVGDGTHPEHVCGYEAGFLVMLDLERKCVRIERFAQGARVDEVEWSAKTASTDGCKISE